MANRNTKNYAKSNNKSKRNGYKNDKQTQEWRETRSKSNNCNDYSWYVPTDQTIKDVASFSLNNIMGTNYRLNGDYATIGSVSNTAQTTAPGVMTLFVTTVPGTGSVPTAPINLASTDLYNEIRRANSGTKVYDAPDCMQLLVALASVYAMVSWAQRLYGMANVYSSSNAYIPRTLIEANGVDVDDLLNNMNNFRARINNLVLQANTFNVPASIPLFQRWYFMFQKIYADSTTNRAQLYQFAPEGYYLYDDTDTTLKFHRLKSRRTGGMTTNEIVTVITDMINSLTYSEDARTISADIEKAFGSRLLNLSQIAEDYSVVPDYSDEMRGQIMNAVIYDVAVGEDSVNATISQDKTLNCLKSEFSMNVNKYSAGNMGAKWLNSHSLNLSPEEIMTSTRLMAIPSEEKPIGAIPSNKPTKWDEVAKWHVVFDETVGSEIITGATIWTGVEARGSYMIVSRPICSRTSDLNTSNGIGWYSVLSSAFDWAPAVHWMDRKNWSEAFSDANSTESLAYVGTVQDIDNGIMLSEENMKLLHMAALLGEFGIPKVRS